MVSVAYIYLLEFCVFAGLGYLFYLRTFNLIGGECETDNG